MNDNSDLNPQDSTSEMAFVAANEGQERKVLGHDDNPEAGKPVVRHFRPAGKSVRSSFRVHIDRRGHSHDID
jgi:hypothetical protein